MHNSKSKFFILILKCITFVFTYDFEVMHEIIFIVEEAPEGGYSAKALQEDIFIDAESISYLKENIIDAIKCHFEPENSPKIVRLHFVKDEVFSVT